MAEDTTRPEGDLELRALVRAHVTKFLALAALLSTAGTTSFLAVSMPVTWYRLQTEFGLLLVLVFATFVAVSLILFEWAAQHPSALVRAAGRGGQVLAAYGGLFVCLLTFSTIMWMIAVVTRRTALPTAETFPADFVVGNAYASMFLFGMTGLAYLVMADAWWIKFSAAIYGTAVTAVPLLALHGPRPVLQNLLDDGGPAVTVGVAYLLLASILGWLLIDLDSRTPSRANREVIARARRRRRRGGPASGTR